MREIKIYTKVGDKGNTSLGSGTKTSKSSQRVEAYGGIDELAGWVALVKDSIGAELGIPGIASPWIDELHDNLYQLQNTLFMMGSELACPKLIPKGNEENVNFNFQVIDGEHLRFLETDIDKMTSFLKPLKNFILPGGHPLISKIHIARAVCRRAEREIVCLSEHEPEYVRVFLITYINRLSDWLFTLARFLACKMDVREIPWRGKL